VILSTQVAEATFVAKEGSPLNTLSDLKGKKVGMSPVGSATYAIAAAVLKNNFGLSPSDYTPIPGNEGRLVQFLQGGDIDAASLRAVTLASVPDLKLKKLGSMVDEWKKMTKTDTVPVLGVTILHKDFARAHPEAVVKFVRGMIAATKFGASEPDKASEILRQAANLDAKDATAYARLWNQIYEATFEPADVATLKKMAEIFVEAKLIEAPVPDSLFNAAPYQKAKQQ
jgi:NitT/TauT family transport system substrate-binding protein